MKTLAPHRVPALIALLSIASLGLAPRAAAFEINRAKSEQELPCTEQNNRARRNLTREIASKTSDSSAPLEERCVILGAGFAGTLANMHSGSQCLIIENGTLQGIQQGHGRMLQKWEDVKFIPPKSQNYRDPAPKTSQPSDFRKRFESEQSYDALDDSTVSLWALEAARACNEQDFGMRIIRGNVSGLEAFGSGARLKVELSKDFTGTAKTVEVHARYVIIATGAGSEPNPLGKDQVQEKDLKELERKKHGIPLALADTQLMWNYRNFPEEARTDTWILSNTNAGAVSVAQFLLENRVAPENIKMIRGKVSIDNESKDPLDEHNGFGDGMGSGYYLFFQLYKPGEQRRIDLLGDESEKDGFKVKRVSAVNTPSSMVEVEACTSGKKCIKATADHFVHAFNMKSEVWKLFKDAEKKKLKARPWLRLKESCEDEQGPLDVSLIGLKVVGENEGKTQELPIVMLGAVTTTIGRNFLAESTLDGESFGKSYDELLKADLAKRQALKSNVYTLASIPYMAPKIACGAQLMLTRSLSGE